MMPNKAVNTDAQVRPLPSVAPGLVRPVTSTLELTVDDVLSFAVVEVHTSPWEAHVGRALLESEGIPAYLGSEHVVTAWWPMSLVFGGVRLLVRREHIAEAQALLALRDRGELEAALIQEYPPEVLRCNRCGSEQIAERRSWLATSLSVMLLFICQASFPPAKDLQCKSCGAPR